MRDRNDPTNERGLERMRKTGAKRIYLATIKYRRQLDRLTDSPTRTGTCPYGKGHAPVN